LNKKFVLPFLFLFSLVVLCLTFSTAAEGRRGYFSVIVLPDTQGYSEKNPGIFLSQTEWIRNSREKLNVELVVHLGDVVENPGSQAEWKRARGAIRVLDKASIPTLIAFGNHDYTNLGSDRTSNLFNKYLPLSRYEDIDLYGGTFSEESADNVFMEFEVGESKYLFLTVEYRPRSDVLGWANRVLEDHPDYRAVVIAHSYIWPNGYRTSNGERIWDELVRKHKNVKIVLCGHVPGSGVEVIYGEGGNRVVQILSDYQYYSDGGRGYLRIMKFYPDSGRVEVRTYSPYLDSYKKGGRDQFSFVVDKKVLGVD